MKMIDWNTYNYKLSTKGSNWHTDNWYHICDPKSQTSHKVGSWPIWFYCEFRNFMWARAGVSFHFPSHCEGKLRLFEFSKMCTCTFQCTILSHFGMYLKIIFANFTSGLWYRVTYCKLYKQIYMFDDAISKNIFVTGWNSSKFEWKCPFVILWFLKYIYIFVNIVVV